MAGDLLFSVRLLWKGDPTRKVLRPGLHHGSNFGPKQAVPSLDPSKNNECEGPFKVLVERGRRHEVKDTDTKQLWSQILFVIH